MYSNGCVIHTQLCYDDTIVTVDGTNAHLQSRERTVHGVGHLEAEACEIAYAICMLQPTKEAKA